MKKLLLCGVSVLMFSGLVFSQDHKPTQKANSHQTEYAHQTNVKPNQKPVKKHPATASKTAHHTTKPVNHAAHAQKATTAKKPVK